jgi:PTS system nitrogen regulatory IIA component
MHLTKHLEPAHLLTGIEAIDREDLFRRMAAAMATPDYLARNPRMSADRMLDAIRRREAERSTAIGNQMALPHARVAEAETLGLVVATLARPVDFAGEPVSLVMMVLAPASSPTLSLQVMASLSRCFSDDARRNRLLACRTADEAHRELAASPLTIDTPLCARDIMRPPGHATGPGTSLTEVARLMEQERLAALPVIDDQRRVAGEVTTDRLLRYGLPDFFQKLHSVSFIAEFDPFEKYFEAEAHACARDVMSTEPYLIPPEYTLLEIVFALTVRNAPQLYVVEDQRWVGTIDRSTVLDRVINF